MRKKKIDSKQLMKAEGQTFEEITERLKQSGIGHDVVYEPGSTLSDYSHYKDSFITVYEDDMERVHEILGKPGRTRDGDTNFYYAKHVILPGFRRSTLKNKKLDKQGRLVERCTIHYSLTPLYI